jgi:pantothenate kinase-related protein Tda10
MLGFRSLGPKLEEQARCKNLLDRYTLSQLEQIDRNLNEYASWWEYLDATILLLPQSYNYVYEWRWEQECSLKRERGSDTVGMSAQETHNFVNKFMPCYELYAQTVERGENFLQLTLDRERSIVSQT